MAVWTKCQRNLGLVSSGEVFPDCAALHPGYGLVLVEAIKNGGEGVRILSPFYIYEQRLGAYSQEMQRLYEG